MRVPKYFLLQKDYKWEFDRKIKNKKISFSNKFEMDGITFEKNSIHLFAFNNPYGACSKCEGFGSIIGLDSEKIIQNKELSVYQGVVSCWSGIKLSKWKDRFIQNSSEYEFPIHKSYEDLNKSSSDKFEYVSPNFVYNKDLDSLNENLKFTSTGFQKKYNTNTYEASIINDIKYLMCQSHTE